MNCTFSIQHHSATELQLPGKVSMVNMFKALHGATAFILNLPNEDMSFTAEAPNKNKLSWLSIHLTYHQQSSDRQTPI